MFKFFPDWLVLVSLVTVGPVSVVLTDWFWSLSPPD